MLSTFNVTSAADDGSAGTLRWAIAQANSATSASAIDIQLGTAPATITLVQGQLELSNTSASITIYNGPGEGPVTISGNNSSRVFELDRGVSASLSGLTITGGYSKYPGAGIWSDATVSLTDCTISNNSTEQAAGMSNYGTATLNDCTINGNTAHSGSGGGLGNWGSASLIDCTISNNFTPSPNRGGGIYDYGRPGLTLTGCTISGNSAGYGGGLYNRHGTAMLTACTISGNSATKDGGGLSAGGTTSLIDCTISGNSAYSGGGIISGAGSPTTLTACTISANSAGNAGGGISSGGEFSGTCATLTDTIVAGNSGTDGYPDDIWADVAGTYNLLYTGGSGGLLNGVDGNIVLTSLSKLDLESLADNGGLTETMALLPGSAAIEAGIAVSGVTTDERGQPLDVPNPDMGAYQTQSGQSFIIVSSAADDGSIGTLRWAIAEADFATSARAIDIQLGTAPATITLTQGQLELSNTSGPITIYDGPGQGPVTISGNNASRVFLIDPNVTAALSGLTITGGSSSANGGGLYNNGTITLTDCTISGNSTAGFGAGMCNNDTATLTDCTLSGNSAAYYGGGIHGYNASTTLTNCTVSGNFATKGGGGVDGFNTTTTLTDCTVSANYAGTAGGGVSVALGTTTLENTIVAGNTNPSGASDINAAAILGSNNLIGTGGSGGLSNGINGNIVLSSLAALDLGPLADNGGPTQTMALLPGSAAIEAGIAVSGINTDQRGQPLDFPLPDIGAFQTQTGQIPVSRFIVTSTLDDGSDGTLRWAITQANSTTNENLIEFELGAAPATITLAQGQLELSNPFRSVTIYDGPGQGLVTISGNNASRVFLIDAGVTASLSGLTITGGSSSGNGGGLYNNGILTLTHCTISGNSAAYYGGAIHSNSATTTLTDCIVSGNSADRSGGGVDGYNTTTTLTDCSIYDNKAGDGGGGLSNALGTTTLTGCTVSGNYATGNGGGMYIINTASLTDCTISGNSTASFGGGICNNVAVTLTGCTLSGNSAAYYGGGIHSYNGSTTLDSCTVSGNSADKGGGGIDGYNTTTILTDCTVDNNSVGNGGAGVSCALGATWLTGCTVSDNTAGGDGGGLGLSDTAALTDCTVNGNSAANYGGGINSFFGITTLTDCTIANNSAGIWGGGIQSYQTTLELLACTVSGNTGASTCGGVYVNGSAMLESTIVAGNTNTAGASDIGGPATVSGSYNLIGTGGSGGLSNGVDGNSVGVADPGLAPLADNGGPTETMLLLPGSPAIEAGTQLPGVTDDQRGNSLDLPVPDIGAYQTQTNLFIVTSTADDGSTATLRWAIDIADEAESPCTIELDLGTAPATLALSQGQLELSNTWAAIAIEDGPGAGPVTISGSDASRVFQVDRYVTATFTRLTIAGGLSSADGGGLYNNGTITLSDCTITGNSAAGSGAGICNNYMATLTDCTINENSGGGIDNHGSATLTDCTIIANSGGGISNHGSATLTGCTLSDNYGGGAWGLNNEGTANLTDCSVSGNTVGLATTSSLALTNCTVSANSGAGLYSDSTYASTMLTDTIVAGNGSSNIHGSVDYASSNNLVETGGAGGLVNGVNGNIVLTSLVGLDLAPLGNYGGPTQTMALLSGSVAIGAGVPVNGVTTDQRGLPLERPLPDIGAFQLQPGEVIHAPSSPLMVTSTAADGSTGTLRWAIGWANISSTPTTIEFDLGAAPTTITLTDGPLVLTNTLAPITIDGPGAKLLAISGDKASSVIDVAAVVTVSFSGLTITGGSTSGRGGGLDSLGVVTLTDCTISDNTAGSGGGVFSGGIATLDDCSIDGNSAAGEGAGLFNSGTIELNGCTISGNSALPSGVGRRSNGGGLYNSLSATLSNCTISGNYAVYGGGIDSTPFYNTEYFPMLLSLTGCTVTGNSATSGGGIDCYGDSADLYSSGTLTDTIVAGNMTTGGTASDILTNSFAAVTGSNNLIGTGGSSDIHNGTDGNIVLASLVSLGLAPLGDYGGPTLTVALLPGSPAIGAGAAVAGLTTDQRGFPLDLPHVDIGAFQTQPDLVVNTTSDGAGSAMGTLSLRQAVDLANVVADAPAITFSPTIFSTSQTINLAAGPLILSNKAGTVTIDGPGADFLSITANGASRVFEITSNVTASLSGLTITGGEVSGPGAGLYNVGTVSVTDCTISGNSAASGGGMDNAGTATITGSTIISNSAQSGGGGLDNFGELTIVDCTVSGNSAMNGGAIYNERTATLNACTISGNTVSNLGGGLYNRGSTTLTDTIVAANLGVAGAASDIGGAQARNATGSNDLIGTGGSGGISGHAHGNIVLTTLVGLGLAPLGNYGGPTQTIALLPGSFALGAGTAESGVSTDQRGESLDSTPDIGAFQSQGFQLVVVAGSTPQIVSPDNTFANPLAVTVTANNPVEPVIGGEISFTVSPASSGASAALSSATAAIGPDGVSEVTATANATPGAYNVSALIKGSGTPVYFSLSNQTAPAFSGLASPSIIFGTASVTISGTLSGGTAVPAEGTVAVTLDGVTQDATIQANGFFSTNFTNSGVLTTSLSPYIISYAYAGSASFAATNATSSLTVSRAQPTVSVSDSGGSYNGMAYTAAATVTGVTGPPASSLESVTPSLSYYSGTYTTAAQLVGVTPLTDIPIHPGQYSVLASFPGSEDYTPASALANFTIEQSSPTITWATPTSIIYGTALSATQLNASANVSGTFVYAQAVGMILNAGANQTLSAVFTPEDATDYSSVDAMTTITVARFTPTLTVIAPGGTFSGEAFPASVTIAGTGNGNDPATSLEGVSPTLTYYVRSGSAGTSLGSTPPVAPGAYAVVASFAGSSDYAPTQSAAVDFTIGSGPTATVALRSSSGSAVYGESLTFVATVSRTGGVPEGTVTFFDGTTPIGNASLNASDEATITTSMLAVGTHSITATYAASGNYLRSTSSATAESVAQDATEVVLVPYGVFKKKKVVSVGLTAEVEPVVPGGGTPTGTITFKVKKKTLGTASLSGGMATLTVKAASVIKKAVTIIYTGDENFTATTATSPDVSQGSLKSLARPLVTAPNRPSALSDNHLRKDRADYVGSVTRHPTRGAV